MKVGSVCVRALLRRKRRVHHRLAKGVLFVAMRVCPLVLPACCCSGKKDEHPGGLLLQRSFLLMLAMLLVMNYVDEAFNCLVKL